MVDELHLVQNPSVDDDPANESFPVIASASSSLQ